MTRIGVAAMAFRIDRVPIKKWEETPNGSLRVLGTIARVGELKYLNLDGTIRTEYLTEDELFNPTWLDSIAMAPATLGHPPEKVTPDNWRKYAVGNVGGIPIPRREDGELDFLHVIHDRAAIDAIRSGKATQLSPGYGVHLRQDSGRLLQYDRVGNHSAIVQIARGGVNCKLHLDGFRSDGDDVAVMVTGNEPINLDVQGFGRREHRTGTDLQERATMPTAITIGNRTYNVDGDDARGLADAIAAVLDKSSQLESDLSTAKSEADEAIKRADSATAELATAQGELKGAQTKLDEAVKRADEAESTRMDGDQLTQAISGRMGLWADVLPAIRMDSPDFEPDWKLDEYDIKRFWLLRQDESFKDDPHFKTDAYVDGLWRSMKPDGKAIAESRADNVDGLEALIAISRQSRSDGYGSAASGRSAERQKAERQAARIKRIQENGMKSMGRN